MKNKSPKVLFFDIETSPNLAYVWGKYEQDVISFKKEWEMLSNAYKWLGEKKVHCEARPHFKDKTEKALVQTVWDLLDEADIVIAHNGQSFDNKKVRAKFIEHGLPPPSPYKVIDTKLIARAQFMFNSNSLDDLGKILGLGRKKQTGGFDLWLKCMAGDKKAWKKMIEYNKQDVVLLEKIYLKLRPWMTNPPSLALLAGDREACPVCASKKVEGRGKRMTASGMKQKLWCRNCGHWFQGKVSKK